MPKTFLQVFSPCYRDEERKHKFLNVNTEKGSAIFLRHVHKSYTFFPIYTCCMSILHIDAFCYANIKHFKTHEKTAYSRSMHVLLL